MDIERLSAYLPMDRRHALATSHPLPDRAQGAVLLADIAGFTPLADALTTALGPQRGAEELTQLLNEVYDALIAQAHRYGSSVIAFSGDGFVCWFEGDLGLRAVACGLAMQEAIAPFAAARTSGGGIASFSVKVGVAVGPVRRFLVGDPEVQQLDVLAGAALERMAQAEQVAVQGEVVVGPAAARELGKRLRVIEWREGFGVVEGLAVEVAPEPWPALRQALSVEQVYPYLLPPVYERLAAGQGEFLAELRPAVMLFLRFGGLDYEGDDAGPRLDAYVRWVQAVLLRYEGYMIQLTTGDKGSFLYAAFGPLAAHEDDVERAVVAALALRQPLPELDFVTEVQIGVSQGWVRAGAYGSQARRTYGAIGDEVNIACRLMEVAPLGEVRCSQRVYRAAGGRWAFEALPPVQVKGKVEPLSVYRPLGQMWVRALRAEEMLVGRQAEVETLARLLAEVKSGQRRILLLEGEAGIGKSRLVGELARLAREGGVTWLLGAGHSIEQRTPYRAWRDLLAAYFGLDDPSRQTELTERQRRVREQVTKVNPALVERTPLLNDILRLDLPESDLTRSFDPKLRHESLTALVIDLLQATTKDSPLTLVLEDAHWLDSISWELALSVARALIPPLSSPPEGRDGGGLLLALALRPLGEPMQAEYVALARLEGAEVLHLEAMPSQETVALAAARLGLRPDALPTEVAELVRERAGGNPFFAEELAYALRDSGAITFEDGACTLAGDLQVLRDSVPDTVEGVVLSRIDRLPPEEQLTLKVAAVIGRSFLYRTLHDVHPQQVVEDLLQAHLDDLAWRGLTPLETLEPELSYLFKHIITQQVAYDTLLFSQRRDLHRTVAGWYERVYADNLSPYYALLVHHWNRAEDAARERRYARLAGEQAAAQYASAEAAAYLARALELTPERDLLERYTLLLTREKVYDLQGARHAQRQDLATLKELAEAVGDERQQAEVALREANYAFITNDYSKAIAAAQIAIDLARLTHNVDHEAAGYLQRGRSLLYQGEYEAAQPQLERALALARTASLSQVEADSLRNLGIGAYRYGNLADAKAYFEQVLDIYREIGDRQGESTSFNNLGVFASDQGDFDQARFYYEQCLRICGEIGRRQGEGTALNNLGLTFHRQEDYARARVFYDQALHIGRQVGDRRVESHVLGNLGLAAQDQGDYVRARAYNEQSLRICREISNRPAEGNALCNLGVIAYYLGDYTEARSYLEQSLSVCREVNYRRGEGWGLCTLGLLFHHLDEDEAAREYSQQAVLIAQELDDHRLEGYALTNLGHALASLGHADKATNVYQRAMTIRHELGQSHRAMESLAGLARVSLAQGNLTQAQAQIDEILRYLKDSTLHSAEEPFRTYLTCYRVLQAVDDPRAQEVLTTAYDLLQEWAARIDDQDLQISFLENVTAHREIVAAYRAMQASDEGE